jgi:hypothetical protein
MGRTTLKNAHLFAEYGQFYISAKYIYEDEYVKKEIIVPKIKIPFCHDDDLGISLNTETLAIRDTFGILSGREMATIYDGMNTLDLKPGKVDGHIGEYFFVEKIIEEKKVDLTIEEIEKKLGYKIRVVGEKNG